MNLSGRAFTWCHFLFSILFYKMKSGNLENFCWIFTLHTFWSEKVITKDRYNVRLCFGGAWWPLAPLELLLQGDQKILRFFIEIICWAPWSSQVQSTRAPFNFSQSTALQYISCSPYHCLLRRLKSRTTEFLLLGWLVQQNSSRTTHQSLN